MPPIHSWYYKLSQSTTLLVSFVSVIYVMYNAYAADMYVIIINMQEMNM